MNIDSNTAGRDSHDALPPSPISFRTQIFRRINYLRNVVVEERIHKAEAKLKYLEKLLIASENAKEKAESANKAKSEFLSNASHEIRTPMGTILGLTRVISATKLDERQSYCLELLQKNAEALMIIVNELLNVDKIEAGIVSLEHAPFSLTGFLNEIIDSMSPRAQEKNIDLVLLSVEDPSEIMIGDRGKIQQIIINLVGNAIKFTSNGGVSISVKKGDEKNGKKRISIAIEDTGIGIPTSRLEAVFDRYVQASALISHQYGGTGLGLPISKKLAEGMGGNITVTSMVGKGSIFTLHLDMPHMSKSQDAQHFVHNEGWQ